MKLRNLLTNTEHEITKPDVYSVTVDHDNWPVILLNNGTYIVADYHAGLRELLRELDMLDLGVTDDGGGHVLLNWEDR